MKKFINSCKIYLFKKRNQVTVSFKVTDTFVNTYIFPVDHFEKMMLAIKDGKEFDQTVHENKWHVFNKPSKECVRVSVWPKRGAPGNEYRIPPGEWEGMRLEYEFQKNNVNAWDNDL